MVIRIVENRNAAPEVESSGRLVWVGGENLHHGETNIPASILAGLVPDLLVGSWYSITDFSALLKNAKLSEAAPWTTLAVEQDGPEGRFWAAIEFNQEEAAKLIAEAAVDFCEGRGSTDELWVRVE